MSAKPKILVFAGSAREGSLNKKLARVAAHCLSEAGAEVTLVDLRDYPIPIYDGDLESREGMPPFAVKLRELFLAHQGLLIASPENNGSVTALLKNTIDWLSRELEGRSGLEPFRGKVAAIMGASPGAFGAISSLASLRPILSKLTVLVIPDQVTLARADQAFKEDGSFIDERQLKSVAAVAKRLVETTTKMSAQ
ncbi:MAG: NAD(P)H-dependent oxidoreductase [Vicinamibacteria bacterium]|jgi:chromate reductase|nr:NAD(P)H-dependent oxidoreductase [Vicinamibacteria bacterium]